MFKNKVGLNVSIHYLPAAKMAIPVSYTIGGMSKTVMMGVALI